MNIPLNPIRRVHEEDENADFGCVCNNVLESSLLFLRSLILPLSVGFHCKLSAVSFIVEQGKEYEARLFRPEGIVGRGGGGHNSEEQHRNLI